VRSIDFSRDAGVRGRGPRHKLEVLQGGLNGVGRHSHADGVARAAGGGKGLPRWSGLVTGGPLAYIANQVMEGAMATRNVVLTEAQSMMIDELVAAGRYRNASEALRAGLRLLEREEAEIALLRERLSEALEQARRGDLAGGTGEDAIRRAFGAGRGAS
jgi:antitoxin ParD1/3/4